MKSEVTAAETMDQCQAQILLDETSRLWGDCMKPAAFYLWPEVRLILCLDCRSALALGRVPREVA